MNTIIRKMLKSDLQQVNGMISRAFTQGRIDDGYAHTEVPMCRADFIEMYFSQRPDGCFVLEELGQIRGAAFCHVWGNTGWIGPLAVAPEKHHLGLGKDLALHAVNYLRSIGCKTIGVETNPRSSRNLGFYGKIGFVPSALSIDMVRPVPSTPVPQDKSVHKKIYYSRLSAADKKEFKLRVWNLVNMVSLDVDYTNLINITDEHHFGETILFMRKGAPIGVVVLQTKPSLVEEQNSFLRIVSFAAHPKTPHFYFSYFLNDIILFAKDKALNRILARVPMYSPHAFRILLENKYRVINSDLRMTLEGYGEQRQNSVFHINRWV